MPTDSRFPELHRANGWAGDCRQLMSFAHSITYNAGPFGCLLITVARRYCDQPCPVSDEESSHRRRQRSWVDSIINSILEARSRCWFCPPELHQRIYDEARALSELPLPKDQAGCNKGHELGYKFRLRLDIICKGGDPP